jgi:HK97 family phage prohead protease
MQLERRFVPFEFKAVGADAPKGSFEGYGSVFGVTDSYNDVVKRGAFKLSLRDWKARKKLPKLLLQHGGGFWGGSVDDLVPVGKWDEMYEDETGLFGRGHVFDIETDRARATYAAMEAGELDGLSIGFQTKKSELDEDTGIRTLTEIALWEVSLVTFPANDPARVSSVKGDLALPTEREFERFLRREAGLTEDQAKAVVAKGYRQVRREAMPSDGACGELVALLNKGASIFTGEQRS